MKRAMKVTIAAMMMALVPLFSLEELQSADGNALAQFIKLPVETKKLRKSPNNAFDFGERLDYDVVYSFIKAGTGFFQIIPSKYSYNGRDCYDVRFQVNSLKSLEFLYKVQDTYRTALDVEGIFPWKFEQRIREGNYKRDSKAEFNQYKNIATFKDKTYNVPEYVHDIVSAFYYVRTLNLTSMPKGKVFYLKNFFDKKVYDLGVKIHGKETVEVKAGKFKCIKIEPLVTEGGLFKSEGSIMIWVTDDENKIPVKVSTKILIGDVAAELTSYSGLRNPMKAKL